MFESVLYLLTSSLTQNTDVDLLCFGYTIYQGIDPDLIVFRLMFQLFEMFDNKLEIS